MSLYVVALVTAKPGLESSISETLSKLSQSTPGEPGCILYSATEVVGEPGSFATVEHWESNEHFQQHLADPVVQEALATLSEAQSAEPVIHQLAPLAD